MDKENKEKTEFENRLLGKRSNIEEDKKDEKERKKGVVCPVVHYPAEDLSAVIFFRFG